MRYSSASSCSSGCLVRDRLSRLAVCAILAGLTVACAWIPNATPTPAGSERIVTLADDGTTVTLRVGERFLLMLGEEYEWMVTSSDEAVVGRVLNILVVRGAQGVYEARKAGRATLSAVGDPPCRKSQPPCAAPSRNFRLEMIVP